MKICLSCKSRHRDEHWKCETCQASPGRVEGFLAFHPELASTHGEIVNYPFDQMYELESRHFWFRARNELILWAMKKHFSLAKNFLEIGCGSGFVLNAVEQARPDLEVFGSEISGLGLAYAAKRLRKATLFQMDAREIPFEDEFDLVGLFDVLEHVPEDEHILSQIRQALVPGGGIAVTVPMHPSLWSHTDEFYGHVRRYARGELEAKLKRQGFEVLEKVPFVFFLLPAMLLSRFVMKMGFKGRKPIHEMQVGNLTNVLMKRAMDLEFGLIRCGVSMPVGGSMLFVARKLG